MSIHKGPDQIRLDKYVTVLIKADAGFTCYGTIGEEKVHVLGPFQDKAKVLRTKLPVECDGIYVKTSANTTWELNWQHYKPPMEMPDKTPIAVTFDNERPLTLQEEIARYFGQMYQMTQEEQHQESPDDIFNFDDEEDDPYATPYTIPDNIDELLAEHLRQPPTLSPADKQAREEPTKPEKERPATDVPDLEKAPQKASNPPQNPPLPE